jgi:hypothetical protein
MLDPILQRVARRRAEAERLRRDGESTIAIAERLGVDARSVEFWAASSPAQNDPVVVPTPALPEPASSDDSPDDERRTPDRPSDIVLEHVLTVSSEGFEIGFDSGSRTMPGYVAAFLSARTKPVVVHAESTSFLMGQIVGHAGRTAPSVTVLMQEDGLSLTLVGPAACRRFASAAHAGISEAA